MSETFINLFSDYGIFFFSALMIFAVIIGTYLENKKQNNIKNELRKYALKNNLKYIDDYDVYKIQEQLYMNKVFEQGHSIKIKNIVINQKEENTIYWGDHTFTTGSGKNRYVHNCSFVAIECKKIMVPDFFVRDERAFFDYLGKLIGGQDINFNGDNDFSPKFVLQGVSEVKVRSFFTAKIRKAFTNNLANQGYRIYGSKYTIVIEQEKQIDNIRDRLKFEQKINNIFSAVYSEQIKGNITI